MGPSQHEPIPQGDFHARAAGRMCRSGEFSRLAHPLYVVLTSALATGDHAFPSSFRAIESKPSRPRHGANGAGYRE